MNSLSLDLGQQLRLGAGSVLRLRTPQLADFSDDALLELCRRNENWRIERDATGDLLLRPCTACTEKTPLGELNRQLDDWVAREGYGIRPATVRGMCLKNGALRRPDTIWTPRERWERLRMGEREGFLPFCADFVAEIIGAGDDREEWDDRMREYRINGTRLGWLIDRTEKAVHVYRQNEPVRTLTEITHLTERRDDAVLPGFILKLRPLWEAPS